MKQATEELRTLLTRLKYHSEGGTTSDFVRGKHGYAQVTSKGVTSGSPEVSLTLESSFLEVCPESRDHGFP